LNMLRELQARGCVDGVAPRSHRWGDQRTPCRTTAATRNPEYGRQVTHAKICQRLCKPRGFPQVRFDNWPPARHHGEHKVHVEGSMSMLARLWSDDQGQDIAEYAVMLAVILVLVVGTIRLIGSNANNAFSSTASAINQ